jgi:hypothetical protein
MSRLQSYPTCDSERVAYERDDTHEGKRSRSSHTPDLCDTKSIDKIDNMARKCRCCVEILRYSTRMCDITIHDDTGYLGEERIDGEDHDELFNYELRISGIHRVSVISSEAGSETEKSCSKFRHPRGTKQSRVSSFPRNLTSPIR